jgi:hypothetical protein
MSPTARASSTSRISGIHIDGYGKREPHHHAARIGLHRLVDEFADFGEVLDILVALVDLPGAEAQDGSVQIDVVVAGEFGIESGAEFQQGRNAPVDRERTAGRLQNAGHHLQQRALAGAVFADDAEGFAAAYFEADIVQGPEILVALQPVKREQLLQPVARRVIDRVALRDTLKFDGVHVRWPGNYLEHSV